MSSRLVTIVGDLDPAGLAALADPHLRLDHAWVTDLLRSVHSGGNAVRVAAVGNRDAVLGEELLSLVLEQVHWVAAAYPTYKGRAAGPDGCYGHAASPVASRKCATWHNPAPRPEGQ